MDVQGSQRWPATTHILTDERPSYEMSPHPPYPGSLLTESLSRLSVIKQGQYRGNHLERRIVNLAKMRDFLKLREVKLKAEFSQLWTEEKIEADA